MVKTLAKPEKIPKKDIRKEKKKDNTMITLKNFWYNAKLEVTRT